MKIYLKKRIDQNDIVFFFILCLTMLSGYFSGASVGFAWASPLWNIGIITMFFIVIFNYILSRKIDRDILNLLLVGGIVFIVFLVVSYMSGPDRGYAWRNVLIIVKVLIVHISVLLFARAPGIHFFRRMKQSFLLFNIWGIMNMIVLTIQIYVKGFMMPSSWLSMNRYYEDLCSGLYGFNGTHRLGIYMTFLFIYNQYYGEFETGKKDRIKIYLYNVLLLGWHFILSTQNDNMTIYMLTAIFFAAYLFLDMYWRNGSLKGKVMKWLKYALIVGVVIVSVLCIPVVRNFVLGKVMDRIYKFGAITSTTAHGSTERLGILLYSFENGFGYKLGKGIGYFSFGGGDLGTNADLGFLHFGISSMSSMIYLLGLWFYLFLVFWISKIYQRLTRESADLFFPVILLIMLFITFYTTNLTSITMSVCLMLLFSVFAMMRERIKTSDMDGAARRRQL